MHVRVDGVRRANTVNDHPKIAWIGNDHLVTPLGRQLTYPPRVGSDLDGNARWRKILKMTGHRFGRRSHTALRQHVSIWPQYTAVAEPISEIDPNRDLFCCRMKTRL